MIIGDAGIEIRPDASGMPAAIEDSATPGLKKSALRMAAIFTAAFAVVGGVGKFLGDAVGQATDLGENLSKVSVVFGDQAGRIEAFASTASTALGQSQNQALEAAGTFGSLFVSMGIGQGVAADMSTSMVTLASDMASFGNASPEEALDALRSGLIGEAEPLRRFGIMLDSAKIEAEALRLGLMTTGGELTEAAKAQAVYSLAMAQTSLQQGDFERTSEGLANQQRIMKAQWTDLSTNIGGLFVPALGEAAASLTGGIIPALLRATSSLPELGNALGAVGDVFSIAFTDGLDAAFDLIEGTEGAARWVGILAANAGDLSAIFREAFVDGAAGSALLGASGLEGFAVTVGHVAFQVREALGGAFDTLAAVVGPALAQVSGAFSGAFGGGEGGGGILGAIAPLLQTIGPLIAGYIGRWVEVIAAVVPIIADVFTALAPVISDVVGMIGPLLQSLLPIVSQVAGVFATTLLAVIQALAPAIPPLVAAIGQVASILSGALIAVLSELMPVLPVIAQAIGQVAAVLAGSFSAVLQALVPVLPVLAEAIAGVAVAMAGALAGALAAIAPVLPVIAEVIGQVAAMLAGALSGALKAVLPILPPLVSALGMIAQVLIGALMGALRAILPVIPMLVGVLLQLIQAAVIPLLPILPLLANLLATIIAAIAPLIPVVVRVIVLLVELAVSALVPLMPVILIVANLITMLISVLVPIIQVLVTIAGAFIGFAATVISIVVGIVSTVVGVWTGLIGTVFGIYSAIFDVIRGVFTSIASWVSGAVGGIAGKISGAFSGVVDAIASVFGGVSGIVSGAFSGAVDAVRGAMNGVIGIINKGIAFINDKLIANANKVPFVNIPDIPDVPTLHSGGYFDSGLPSGEGLALLRDGELVVTPEQQASAKIITGPGPGAGGVGAGAVGAAGGLQVVNNIVQQPGESGVALAAAVSQRVVWNLSHGVTRTVATTGAPS